MRSLSAVARSVAALATALSLSSLAASAQTFSANVTARAPAMIVADNSAGHVSVPGHHHDAQERLIYARVRDGVYTVDGMVAKIRLNYDVQGANYMYLFVPGVGTALVSVAPEADAVVAPASLHDDELTFSLDGHRFNLTGVALESDKGQPPAHLYVRLDRSAWRLSRMPMVGFGNRAALPYEWPGALHQEQAQDDQTAPPVPSSLLPRTAALTPVAASPATPHPAALR